MMRLRLRDVVKAEMRQSCAQKSAFSDSKVLFPLWYTSSSSAPLFASPTLPTPELSSSWKRAETEEKKMGRGLYNLGSRKSHLLQQDGSWQHAHDASISRYFLPKENLASFPHSGDSQNLIWNLLKCTLTNFHLAQAGEPIIRADTIPFSGFPSHEQKVCLQREMAWEANLGTFSGGLGTYWVPKR